MGPSSQSSLSIPCDFIDDLSARLLEDEAMDDETLDGFIDRLFDFEKNNLVVNEASPFI